MKKTTFFLAMILLICLCLSGCGEHDITIGIHDDMIKKSIRELEAHWADWYDEIQDSREVVRYFEIKNTRVIKLRENEYEELQDIAYIVDFSLYTDYFGSETYSVNAMFTSGIRGGAVAVYTNGDMEVVSNTLLRDARYDITSIGPPDEVVDFVVDCGDAYNCKKILN